ncbi:hypothetical protein TNCV_2105491 [Trichonephila clavipes]|nr:hypothetical protein TNCV_2105491 [Trichonephila clavipes]
MKVTLPVCHDPSRDYQTTSTIVFLLDNVREPILNPGFFPDGNTSPISVYMEPLRDNYVILADVSILARSKKTNLRKRFSTFVPLTRLTDRISNLLVLVNYFSKLGTTYLKTPNPLEQLANDWPVSSFPTIRHVVDSSRWL